MIRCMGVMSDGGNCIALPGGGTRPETGDGNSIAVEHRLIRSQWNYTLDMNDMKCCNLKFLYKFLHKVVDILKFYDYKKNEGYVLEIKI